MSSLVKFLYYISIFFFFVNALFCYYQFPDFVPIGFSENIGLKEYKSKSYIFYSAVGLFFTVNILMTISKILIKSVPFSAFRLPNKSFWLQSTEHRDGLILLHQVWFNSFCTLFNVFLGVLFLILFLVNIAEYGSFQSYIPVVYGFITMLSIWWIVLLIRLNINKIEL